MDGPRTPNKLPRLTNLQMQILYLIAEGRENQDIAKALNISLRNVHDATGAMIAKFGTSSRVAWMHRYGTWIPHAKVAWIRCSICDQLTNSTEEIVTGGLFRVPVCSACKARLEEVRLEAKQRKSLET